MITKEEMIDLDKQINAIQRSTRTLFPTFLNLHNNLRMKYRWYYNWHLFNYANAIHSVFLILFTLFTVALSTNVVLDNPKTSKAAGLNCVSQAVGDWSNAATWTSCGGGVPGSGDNATISHLVTLMADVNLGTGNITITNGGTLRSGVEEWYPSYDILVNNLNIDSGGGLSMCYDTGIISIAGNLENNGQLITSCGGIQAKTYFTADTPGHTIKTIALSDVSLYFSGGGEWTLQSDLSAINSSIYVSNGNLIAGGYDISATWFTLNGGDFTGGEGSLTTGMNFIISNAQSHFIAPASVSCAYNGEGTSNYIRSAGTADWLTNNSQLTSFNLINLPSDIYNNLALSGTANVNDDITVMGNLTVIDNQYIDSVLNIAEHTLDVRGYLETSDPSGGIEITTGTLKVGDNFTVRDGGLNAGTGTVQFTGTNQTTVSGSNTFNDLTVDTIAESAGKTVSFTSGTTQTIGGALTLNGDSGKELILDSSPSGNSWNLVIGGDLIVGDYLNVSNSRISGGTITTGDNSIDGGSNVGWIFGTTPEPTPTPTSTPTPSSSTSPTPTPTPSSAPSSTSSSTPTPTPSTSTTVPVIALHDSINDAIHYLSNNTKPTISTKRPTFSGTTYPNSTVKLTIQSNPINATTTSDNKGYWSYTLDQDLEYGDHTIKITVTTPQGKTYSSPIQSFTIASAKETPLPPPSPPLQDNTDSTTKVKNNNTYYWIILSGFILILLIITGYILYKKKR